MSYKLWSLLWLSCLLHCSVQSAAQAAPPPSAQKDPVQATTAVSYRQQQLPQTGGSKLLLILIDGLRWDAINTSHTLHDDQQCSEGCVDPASFFTVAQREGATAAWNVPVFPTTPTPNANTIATGLLPATHGVLSATGRNLSTAGVAPIWETSVNAGKRTALISWTSCPKVLESDQDPLLSCQDRAPLSGVDNLLVQLMGDAARAAQLITEEDHSLVMMRTELIYWASEHYGPTSDVVGSLVAEVETVLGDMFRELQDAGVWDELSVALVSSNGLASTSPAAVNSVTLSSCFTTPPQYRYFSAGSAILMPDANTTAKQIAEQLERCEELPEGAATWYRKTELPGPDQWPGGAQEMLIVASHGFALRHEGVSEAGSGSLYSKDGHLQLGRAEDLSAGGRGRMAGDGYGGEDDNMNGIFIAKGPGVVRGVTGGSVLQTDVYSVLCAMAGLPPEQHHGHKEAVTWMIAPNVAGTERSSHSIVALLLATTTVISTLLTK